MEPRDTGDTRKVLYETTLEQTKLLDRYNLPGTFLLQYDALIDPEYQTLMKGEEAKGREVGAWWEITQPHIEAAGMKWRGRFPWDWHANVGFATGYTPQEREKLADVYMEKFKSVFGHYPESVGSWFIDAHTLGYMYDKYGIKASCNCKDQYGTDGYTLWGGYWNQAYYPSRLNAYMPAQTAKGQIPVPVFRMLGSDPIYQYDMSLTGNGQGVVTLEPVYGSAGADERWVDVFFDSIFEDPALGFNYTQAGQENSFTWAQMQKGLEMQIPKIAAFRKSGKIEVMTLADAGKWFTSKYKLTPPTSLSCLGDTYAGFKKTVWFDSRFYRFNLLWVDDFIKHGLRCRDYERYCDDFLLYSNDKKYLNDCREKIGEFLRDTLFLAFSKCDLFDVRQGVDFCGYRHFGKYVLLRKSTAKRTKRRFRRGVSPQSAASTAGWCKWACTYNFRRSLGLIPRG